MENLYDRAVFRSIAAGQTPDWAMLDAVEDYLDGKPHQRGKKRITRSERDAMFWAGNFLSKIAPQLWRTDALTLALARYLGQTRVSCFSVLESVALLDPEVVCRAIRYSQLVLTPLSPRRAEVEQIASSVPEIDEMCRVLDIFDHAHKAREADVARHKEALSGLSPVGLLAYASLYAFEHLIPPQFETSLRRDDFDTWLESVWDAINDLFVWKLTTSEERALKPGEHELAESLAEHLIPFLFPSPSGARPRHDLRDAFSALVEAQIELNTFMSQSVDAFCLDDGIRFVRHENRLEIAVLDPLAKNAWRRQGEKMARLHGYWFQRALEQFVAAGMALQTIGRPENHEANRLAYIQAMRIQSQLSEVYGIADVLVVDTGESLPLFPALLSLTLSSAFYQRDFLEAYMTYWRESGDWRPALGRLAWESLREGQQNRFPMSWADRQSKAAGMVGWTVCVDLPQGSQRLASLILDFWTSDWVTQSVRLRAGERGLTPALFERPFLKIGHFIFTLPWVFGLQNNSSAAINNLRRLGARRHEVKEETRRIESNLGRLFEQRGFRVVFGWDPSPEQFPGAGEVDLICAMAGVVIVIEVKSSFLRRSQRDAWLHGKFTLRRAGRQLRRKVAAIAQLLGEGGDLAGRLGVGDAGRAPEIYGWIVDTSLEHDRQRFEGFLKVSLEEVLIALRDECHLLDQANWLFSGRLEDIAAASDTPKRTLYPEGFSALRFVQAVEGEETWAGMLSPQAV